MLYEIKKTTRVQHIYYGMGSYLVIHETLTGPCMSPRGSMEWLEISLCFMITIKISRKQFNIDH